ncbi:helix-turn-helix transcriptional regulator [Acidithiobacillus sp.]|uniref:helix-turn-helix domain-containing protein n=1 Tax=Acidithiobacillus sp. TaxID=1872118 RepID=UPI0026273530|nr:helix-turn-helix transcriptional regulator [Acidithiobacillus sp.]MDD2749817.1 helix-turn-helix transcriptional regulator [Acidithiobacillus sp.]MDD5280667.1 helix-turn-helix transcriptional regulator [Acidithiobacillus sp.]
MKSIVDIRLQNFRALLAKHKQAELARMIGRSPTQVQQWAAKACGKQTKGARNIDSITARRLEVALGLPANWMDNDHETSNAPLPGAEPTEVAQHSEQVPGASFDWSNIPPAARALVETVAKKSSEGDLDEADLALLLSTVSRLSSKE